MNFSYAIFVVIILSLGSAVPLSADGWSITQEVSVTSNTSILQEDSSDSVQAFNSINLDSTSGVVTEANQSLTMGGHDLTLTQVGGNSNKQAVNIIASGKIIEANQTLSGAGSITLSQSAGMNNLQVVNAAITSGSGSQIDTLNQSVTADSFTFSHQGGGSSNIQAGNYIEADATNPIDYSLTQNFTVNTLNYVQDGTNNIQAGNILVKNAGYTGGIPVQNFNAGSINLSLPATLGNGSIAAGNYIIQR